MSKHQTVDEYIADCSDVVAPFMTILRMFINETLTHSTEGMSYGVPVFFNAHMVPVIYLFGSKDHVNFGFLRVAELSDPEGILEGSGKPSKHIKLFPEQPVKKAMLRKFIKQCEKLQTEG